MKYVLRAALPDEQEREAVSSLIAEYLSAAAAQLEQNYGIANSPTDIKGIRASLDAFNPPGGALIVAESGGVLVGVGALRSIGPGIGEIKRMYVAPSWRGQGLGAAILDRIVDTAINSNGAHTVRLDTCLFMDDAQRLYRSRKFIERPPYEGTEIPPHLHRYWRFFERDVSGAAGAPTR